MPVLGESTLATLKQWVTALESLQDSHVDMAVSLQFHIEDLEDQSSNNLRLRGPPEATGSEDLSETAADILRRVMGD